MQTSAMSLQKFTKKREKESVIDVKQMPVPLKNEKLLRDF